MLLPMAKDFVDVIKLMTLRWGDYAALSRWALCNHKGTRRSQSQKEGNVIMEAEGEKVLQDHELRNEDSL